jgi:hypothetical protein
MKKHLTERTLALACRGELTLLERVAVRLHLLFCDQCRHRIDVYRADVAARREWEPELPAYLNWNHLAAEMKANIRLGHEVDQIPLPSMARSVAAPAAQVPWRGLAFAGSMAMMILAAWTFVRPGHFPDRGQTASFTVESAQHKLLATGDGLMLQGRDSALTMLAPAAQRVSLSVEMGEAAEGNSQRASNGDSLRASNGGSLRASYLDANTGMVTINHVVLP